MLDYFYKNFTFKSYYLRVNISCKRSLGLVYTSPATIQPHTKINVRWVYPMNNAHDSVPQTSARTTLKLGTDVDM